MTFVSLVTQAMPQPSLRDERDPTAGSGACGAGRQRGSRSGPPPGDVEVVELVLQPTVRGELGGLRRLERLEGGRPAGRRVAALLLGREEGPAQPVVVLRFYLQATDHVLLRQCRHGPRPPVLPDPLPAGDAAAAQERSQEHGASRASAPRSARRGTTPEVGCRKSPVRPTAVSSREASPIARKAVRGYGNQWRFRRRNSKGCELLGGEPASPMDPIRGFCGKLRSLAVTLDSETARLQRALDGEDSDFEDCPMRVLHDLNSEVRILKDDVNILLDKANLESQENIGFIKATKILMKKNSMDIMKIKEFFQKYGYIPRARKNSVDEQEVTDSKPESSECERPEMPDVKDNLLDSAAASTSVPEKSPRSPQLSDFGLERYIVSQVIPNPPQAVNNQKEEPKILTPLSKHSLVKTPKCALKMDDFECVTPKLEHFGISEYTMCLNDDYTVGLKNVKTNSETKETEPVPNDNVFATPGLITQPLGKNNAEHTHSPLAPTFCTPGLKVPSTKSSTAMVSTNSSSNDLETKETTSLVSNSDKCFENFAEPSSPTISSYENLLKTPTPPEVTMIPEDIRQILSKYNSNLASPGAVRAVSPIVFLPRHGGQNMRDASNKENW